MDLSEPAQQSPPHEPWSDERRMGWNDGYLAGLNDATLFTTDALSAAAQRKRDRMAIAQRLYDIERDASASGRDAS